MKMGTIIHRCLAVCVSVGSAYPAWEYLCFKLLTFWTFRSFSVTRGSVDALKRIPPFEKLVQDWDTYRQYTNVST